TVTQRTWFSSCRTMAKLLERTAEPGFSRPARLRKGFRVNIQPSKWGMPKATANPTSRRSFWHENLLGEHFGFYSGIHGGMRAELGKSKRIIHACLSFCTLEPYALQPPAYPTARMAPLGHLADVRSRVRHALARTTSCRRSGCRPAAVGALF